MKREELTALGLTEAQAEQVMKVNGEEVAAERARAEGLQAQLDTATDGLKRFEGVDVSALQGQVQQLQNDLAEKEREYREQLAQREFSALLDGAISAAKGKNTKAIGALLDMDALKASKNQEADIRAALDALKQENSYLFEDTQTPPPYAAGTGTAPVGGKYTPEEMAIRAAAGLKTE